MTKLKLFLDQQRKLEIKKEKYQPECIFGCGYCIEKPTEQEIKDAANIASALNNYWKLLDAVERLAENIPCDDRSGCGNCFNCSIIATVEELLCGEGE